MKRLALVFAVLLTACPPASSPPTPDADAASAPSSPAAACSHLAAIGCIEGADTHCAAVLEHVVDAGLTPINVRCLASASTKEAARSCGGVSCP